ncbi:MAG: molecular chaperone DnaJ [Candidatus Gastranaerophilales bacterium]|nr:molecular chaperone DnaJ [Candidatus Gastranaerophilales bacterium]
MQRDYYEILGLGRESTQDDIKKAFRKKARELHPDVNKAPDAEERFKELGQAYEVLSNEEKRSMYDRYGFDGLKNAGFDTSGPFDFGFGDLGDILSSFFGAGFAGGYSRSNPNAPQRGSDLRLDINIAFKEAVFGIEKEVEIDHLETCESCDATGAKKGSSPVTCPTCGGAGQIRQTTRTIMGTFTQVGICPDCSGTGKKILEKCPDCNGEGRKTVSKKINIKIPAGVDNGAQMRVQGQGDAGTKGGPNGDLYIVIHTAADKKFKRDDFNIFSTEYISFSQAVLGDEIEVETLEGTHKIKVAPSTQTDTIIKIKNQGVPYLNNPSKRGDAYVKLVLSTPVNVSEEERKLYQRLFEIENHKKSKESILDKVRDAISGSTK